MLGGVSWTGDQLVFEARFAWLPGERYTAVVQWGAASGKQPWTNVFSVPPSNGDPPRVVAVYPQTRTIPANLLRFYIFFSEQMEEPNPHGKIRLKVNGKSEPLPFVEVKTGLWDPEQRRLTLILHPGRIKRGVGPNLTMGAVLHEGQIVELEVDGSFIGHNGKPLGEDIRVSYQVSEALRDGFDPSSWKATVPTAGSMDPLIIRFDRAMDEVIASRLIKLVDAPASIVTTSPYEMGWYPETPWAPSELDLQVAPTMEDLAGNRPGVAFDHDIDDPAKEAVLTKTVSIQ